MTFARSISIIAVAVAAATPTWSASNGPLDSHHPLEATENFVAQATTTPRMGMGGMAAMPGYADQMKAMQGMHNKMMATKTPEERHALMSENMNLMQGGMGMMGGPGHGAMAGKPEDMASRMGMMEQRMNMMRSMMQMMMDQMQPAATAK